jgi:hypothetical protein
METCGENHEDVHITHACGCLGPDCFVSGRYDIVPMAVAYLFGFDLTNVHSYGEGGWYYDNPLKQQVVKHFHPDLMEFREALEHVDDVPAFFRQCGVRYEEPPPPESSDA